MKLLIASDIHGSAYYAKKVVECFEKEKADKLKQEIKELIKAKGIKKQS